MIVFYLVSSVLAAVLDFVFEFETEDTRMTRRA